MAPMHAAILLTRSELVGDEFTPDVAWNLARHHDVPVSRMDLETTLAHLVEDTGMLSMTKTSSGPAFRWLFRGRRRSARRRASVPNNVATPSTTVPKKGAQVASSGRAEGGARAGHLSTIRRRRRRADGVSRPRPRVKMRVERRRGRASPRRRTCSAPPCTCSA